MSEASALQAHMKQGLPTGSWDGDRLLGEGGEKVGGRSRKNCFNVRCCVLRRATREGLVRSGICVSIRLKLVAF